jgi:Holliday junction resolvase RusA-like endonuclease
MNTQGVGVCSVCGGGFNRRSPSQKYCQPCSAVKDDERRRAWSAKNPRVHPPGAVAAYARESVARTVSAGAERNRSTEKGVTWASEPLPPMRWRVTFAVPFGKEASKNHIFRVGQGGHVYLRSQSKAYRQMVADKTREAVAGLPVVQAKVWIDVLVQKPHHKGDAVNVLDLLFDGIKEGLGVDDRWFCIRRLDWQIVKESPHVIIGIGQIEKSHRLACSHCGKILRLERFGAKKNGPFGRTRACKACLAAGRKKVKLGE